MVSRAKMEAVLCREQVQRGSRVVLQSHSRTVKRGLTGALGPDKEGRSLDFCERCITALAWRWWVGKEQSLLKVNPQTVPVTGRREEALHSFPEKQ